VIKRRSLEKDPARRSEAEINKMAEKKGYFCSKKVFFAQLSRLVG